MTHESCALSGPLFAESNPAGNSGQVTSLGAARGWEWPWARGGESPADGSGSGRWVDSQVEGSALGSKCGCVWVRPLGTCSSRVINGAFLPPERRPGRRCADSRSPPQPSSAIYLLSSLLFQDIKQVPGEAAGAVWGKQLHGSFSGASVKPEPALGSAAITRLWAQASFLCAVIEAGGWERRLPEGQGLA